MHLTKFFANSWLKTKTKQISGTLKSQVSNHKKQKEITDLSLYTKVYLIQNSLLTRDLKKPEN